MTNIPTAADWETRFRNLFLTAARNPAHATVLNEIHSALIVTENATAASRRAAVASPAPVLRAANGAPLRLAEADLKARIETVLRQAQPAFVGLGGVDLEHAEVAFWVGGDATRLYRSAYQVGADGSITLSTAAEVDPALYVASTLTPPLPYDVGLVAAARATGVPRSGAHSGIPERQRPTRV